MGKWANYEEGNEGKDSSPFMDELTYSQSTTRIIQLFLHEKSPQNHLSPFEQVNSYPVINDLLAQDLIN